MKKIAYDPAVVRTPVSGTRQEMNQDDHNFLACLLAMKQPTKILEVGVALGGTSVFMLRNTGADQRFYGIDIRYNWWNDKTKETGSQISELCTPEEQSRYRLLLGRDPVERMEEVGDGIDFCILDTAHRLPGELLQFIAVYPYLKKDAIIVMHDISLNFHPKFDSKQWRRSYSTKVLFIAAGSRQKMLPDVPWPNIGAFVVDDETRRNMNSTFFALSLTWEYYDEPLLEKYMIFIREHYNKFCQNIFEQCMINQKRFFN